MDFSIALKDKDALKCIDFISNYKTLAVDIETSGFDYTPDQFICGIGVATSRETGFYFPIKSLYEHDKVKLSSKIIDLLMDIIKSKDVKKIFHNAKFDVKFLERDYGKIEGYIEDTMIMAAINGHRKFGLTHLTKEYFSSDEDEGYNPLKYNNLVEVFRTMYKPENFAYIPACVLGAYCCEDVCNTYSLFEILSIDIDHYESYKTLYEIELELLRVLIDMEMYGATIDIEYLNKLNGELEVKLSILNKELQDTLQVENVNSSRQIEHALLHNLGVKLFRKTASGKHYSVDEKTLKAIRHPIVKKLLEYRKLMKLKSTYVEGFLSRAVGNKIHTNYSQIFVKTGRLSSSNPNLQNIPKKYGDVIRRAFVIGKKDWALVYFDLSQIELRLLAHFSNDTRMLDALMKGEDIHQATANALSLSRDIAKNINFGIIYGMSAPRLGMELGITTRKAEKFLREYFAQYPGVKKFKAQLEAFGISNGYVSTWLGRKVSIDEKEIYASINYKIQGSAADILKLMMNRQYNYVQHEELESKMIMSIHDETIMAMPEYELDHIVGLKQVAEDFDQFKLPIICNVAASWTHWGEKEELEV